MMGVILRGVEKDECHSYGRKVFLSTTRLRPDT
jgi:hypothetical protein